MTYLLLRLLEEDLKEYTYAARRAGLVDGWSGGPGVGGGGMALGGSSTNLPLLLSSLLTWRLTVPVMSQIYADMGKPMGILVMVGRTAPTSPPWGGSTAL